MSDTKPASEAEVLGAMKKAHLDDAGYPYGGIHSALTAARSLGVMMPEEAARLAKEWDDLSSDYRKLNDYCNALATERDALWQQLEERDALREKMRAGRDANLEIIAATVEHAEATKRRLEAERDALAAGMRVAEDALHEARIERDALAARLRVAEEALKTAEERRDFWHRNSDRWREALNVEREHSRAAVMRAALAQQEPAMTDAPGNWPARPGVPLNPEISRPHWLTHSQGFMEQVEWSADAERSHWSVRGDVHEHEWTPEEAAKSWPTYHAPVLPPAEVAALVVKAVAAERERVEEIVFAAWPDGMDGCEAVCDAIRAGGEG